MTDISVRNRFRASSVTIVISIALVLVMIGLLSVMVLKVQSISNYFREQIVITVSLDKDADDADIFALQKAIDAEPWRKSTEYVPKDSAAQRLRKSLGANEDFVATLGYNPLLPSIEIYPKAGFTDSTNIKKIVADIQALNEKSGVVHDISYDKDLVRNMNRNIRSVAIGILVFSAALLFIAVGLIFNTIRLSIYAQRFLIRTMSLVGATGSFIRRPFIWRGIVNGVIGAVIAIGVTCGIVLSFDKKFSEAGLIRVADVKTIAVLCGMQIALGIIITWISSSLAVRKFLRQGTDALYSN